MVSYAMEPKWGANELLGTKKDYYCVEEFCKLIVHRRGQIGNGSQVALSNALLPMAEDAKMNHGKHMDVTLFIIRTERAKQYFIRLGCQNQGLYMYVHVTVLLLSTFICWTTNLQTST